MRNRLINVLLFVLLLSAVLDKAGAETQNIIWTEKPSRYKLHVKNESQQSGTVCVYQTFPDQDNFYSLAWFSKAWHPDTKLRFEWDLKYSFVWYESEEFEAEMKLHASESKYVDPNDVYNNHTLLSREYGAYIFKKTKALGKKGILTIKVDDSVPNNRVTIGIGVGGKPAIVVNAFANMTYQFKPKPTYWIVFGNFAEGQDLDVNRMSQAVAVVFDPNVYEKSLTFTASNLWEVTD